ncbi:MAG: carboxypeptidase-like regulatory domain-containing protein, partial [Candidatus Krumholzibacteriota bacterium]
MYMNRKSHLFVLLIIAVLTITGGCTEDDPTPTGCPVPTVEGLTPVENLAITDDPIVHATVTLSWQSPLPNPADLAVEKFEIRVHQTGGTITEENWCTLPVLGTLPSGDKIGFFGKFDHEDAGIVPGATESFAVRPVYENGDLGPVGTVISHRPTAPFTVEGLVRDDTTSPIPGMTVRLMEPDLIPENSGIVTSVETGPDGRFPPLGPISDLAAMVVATDSPDTLTTPDAEDSFFDFTTEPITADTY